MERVTSFSLNEEQLPLVFQAKEQISLPDFLSLLRENREFFRKKILKNGGLLFRKFPINGPDDFSAVIEALNLGSFINYIGGGAPRSKVKNSVYTSTEAPPAIQIHLHNEMSFNHTFPRHIYFYCDIPPEEGGETFIGDARKIYHSVDEGTKKRFTENGIKYISRYYHKSKVMDLMNKIQRGHKTWIDVFETEDKQQVEKSCKENNIGFKWLKNDWLEIHRIRPATYEHPETNEKVWFNQAHLFEYTPRFLGWPRYIGAKLFYCRKNTMVDEVFYPDGTKISRKDIYNSMDALDKHSIYFPWEKGDVMVLDNVLTMHARAPFKGKRRILTAMTQ